MRFGDVVVAVASFFVITLFLSVVMGYVLTPIIGWDWGPGIGSFVSVLIGALIVGVVFSKMIWEEAGAKTIGKIVVLGAVLGMFYFAIEIPTQVHWGQLVKETFQNANPGTTLTTSQWFSVESAALSQEIAFNLLVMVVLGFIGLYVGSMIRKPKKS